MIQEKYVSFDTAKLLKEKGFNEKCWGLYASIFDDEDNPITVLERWVGSAHNNSFEDESFICSAPTQQMAMRWLREVHHLNIEPYFEYYLLGYSAEIKYTNKDTPLYLFEYLREKWFNTYEEACEEAIKYSLEHLI